MIAVKCMECGVVYKTINDGTDDVQVSHGYCPPCGNEVLEFTKRMLAKYSHEAPQNKE